MNRRNDRTIGLLFRDLLVGVQNMLLGEVQLIQTELRRTAQVARRRSMLAALSFSVALIGLIPLMGFLVLALGKVMGERYALSSLIVGIFFLATGSFFAFYFTREIPLQGFFLPRTRESLQQEALLIFQRGPKFKPNQEQRQEKNAS